MERLPASTGVASSVAIDPRRSERPSGASAASGSRSPATGAFRPSATARPTATAGGGQDAPYGTYQVW